MILDWLLKWNLATFGTITNFKTLWFLSYLPCGNWNRKLHHDQGIIHIHYFNGGKFEYSIGLIVILNTCNTCISLIDFFECSVYRAWFYIPCLTTFWEWVSRTSCLISWGIQYTPKFITLLWVNNSILLTSSKLTSFPF